MDPPQSSETTDKTVNNTSKILKSTKRKRPPFFSSSCPDENSCQKRFSGDLLSWKTLYPDSQILRCLSLWLFCSIWNMVGSFQLRNWATFNYIKMFVLFFWKKYIFLLFAVLFPEILSHFWPLVLLSCLLSLILYLVIFWSERVP